MTADDVFGSRERDEQWVSATDLLGGTLIIFLLMLLYFMLTTQQQSATQEQAWKQTVTSLQNKLKGAQINVDSVREVTVLYDQKREELYHRLLLEFGQDLPKWNAEIEKDLTIRFNEPDVLFGVGSAQIREDFQRILNDFFPRYLAVLTTSEFGNSISELRIEGHTSSFWNLKDPAPVQVAYLKNMDLSYERSRSVLRFVMALPQIERQHLPWLREHLTANGLSSSRRILNPDGSENYSRSQRVEFRLRTDAESRMARILEGDS